MLASALCLVFMLAEVVGGVLSNSLAIATDAAHLLTGGDNHKSRCQAQSTFNI